MDKDIFLDELLNLPKVYGKSRSPDGNYLSCTISGVHSNIDIFLLEPSEVKNP
jgi:hypothetical protein